MATKAKRKQMVNFPIILMLIELEPQIELNIRY